MYSQAAVQGVNLPNSVTIMTDSSSTSSNNTIPLVTPVVNAVNNFGIGLQNSLALASDGTTYLLYSNDIGQNNPLGYIQDTSPPIFSLNSTTQSITPHGMIGIADIQACNDGFPPYYIDPSANTTQNCPTVDQNGVFNMPMAFVPPVNEASIPPQAQFFPTYNQSVIDNGIMMPELGQHQLALANNNPANFLSQILDGSTVAPVANGLISVVPTHQPNNTQHDVGPSYATNNVMVQQQPAVSLNGHVTARAHPRYTGKSIDRALPRNGTETNLRSRTRSRSVSRGNGRVSRHMPVSRPTSFISDQVNLKKIYRLPENICIIPRDSKIYDIPYHGAPTGKISVSLVDFEMWSLFDKITNEMIITKTGRRTYPYLMFQIRGLYPEKKYKMMCSFVQLDKNRYKFNRICQGWKENQDGDEQFQCTSACLDHPDGIHSGQNWMNKPISFFKTKITNSQSTANIRLTSMRKYAMVVSVVCLDEYNPLRKAVHFCFEITRFIAVTAYQNRLITDLKIEKNQYAKGFKNGERNKRLKKSKYLDAKSTSEEEPVVQRNIVILPFPPNPSSDFRR